MFDGSRNSVAGYPGYRIRDAGDNVGDNIGGIMMMTKIEPAGSF